MQVNRGKTLRDYFREQGTSAERVYAGLLPSLQALGTSSFIYFVFYHWLKAKLARVNI